MEAVGTMPKATPTNKRLEEMAAVAAWYRHLQETNNETFMPLFFDKHRYLVLKGGGGSGKSIFAGRKVLERVTSEAGHRWLVCRKTSRSLRESCFDQLKAQALESYADSILKIPQGENSDMYLKFKNGSRILFSGLDDVEKLKSIHHITGIWIEETTQLEEGDFNQLDIRMRDETPFYQQIILTFNPVSATHWLKKRFFDRRDPDATVHESTYLDNRFLRKEARRTLEAFKETDEYYYMVYCLGQWGVTGKTVFNARAIAERLAAVQDRPRRQGFFAFTETDNGTRLKDWAFAEEAGGPITVYREPVPGRPYVIGGDTAGDGSDWFVAQVLDNITGEQVAVLRHRYEEDTYAKQVFCLGKYYNDALVGIETNFSTYPVKLLDKMGYTRQYVREVEDEFDGKIRHSFGFKTTAVTRPVIIAELIAAMREGLHLIHDRATLEEMLTFVRNDKLRPEAEHGAHDDTIMALAIAWYIRPQQKMQVAVTEEVAKTVWTADMWEDYRRADAETRKRFVEKWGPPR